MKTPYDIRFLLLISIYYIKIASISITGKDIVHNLNKFKLHFHYVLSMGAVFALYSAWYFWIPKILGMDYNKSWGKIHFWILFVGVNVTFFPQHFLGLQGMPRRISDYPDAFAGWNLVSSLGSITSVIATWLFLYILYVQLVEAKGISRYPWVTPQFYYDILQTYLVRAFNSLEWGLNSPPKPHAFVSLPVQSRAFFPTMPLLSPDKTAEKSEKVIQLATEKSKHSSMLSEISVRKQELENKQVDYDKINKKHAEAQDYNDHEAEHKYLDYLEPALEKINGLKATVENMETKLAQHQDTIDAITEFINSL